jgi:hypothetical protein
MLKLTMLVVLEAVIGVAVGERSGGDYAALIGHHYRTRRRDGCGGIAAVLILAIGVMLFRPGSASSPRRATTRRLRPASGRPPCLTAYQPHSTFWFRCLPARHMDTFRPNN